MRAASGGGASGGARGLRGHRSARGPTSRRVARTSDAYVGEGTGAERVLGGGRIIKKNFLRKRALFHIN